MKEKEKDKNSLLADQWSKEVMALIKKLHPLTALVVESLIIEYALQTPPQFSDPLRFYEMILDLMVVPEDEETLNHLAQKHLSKNQILTSAGARIYYGDRVKALMNQENELLRDGYVRSEEEWWFDAEAKPAILHLLTDPVFREWFENYYELDIITKTQRKIKRKVVEDVTAKTKPYSGKIQRTDEIGKYAIDREKQIPTEELENIGENTGNVDSSFDYTYGYPTNKVRALMEELKKLDGFTQRLLLTEHGQAGKYAKAKADNTIKALSEESGISESALRQRKKRYISELIVNVTNALSKPID